MVSKLRIVFFGTPDFAFKGLEKILASSALSVAAVVTQPDRPAGKGKKLLASPVKTLAMERGIPILQPESIKKEGEAFILRLKDFGPFDIGVVIAFGQILPQRVLNIPSAGCVNVHASLLPRWRGAAPIQRAIMAGDAATGVCLMQMEAGLDTGPVYSKVSVPIDLSDTFGTMHDKLAAAGSELLFRDILPIARGELKAMPQPQEGVSYAAKVANDEARINWNGSALEVSRLIRGFSPVPGAFTSLEGERLKIFMGYAKEPYSGKTLGPPGSVHFLDPRNLEICCGSGVVAVHEVQLEGRRRMEIEEFLRGVKINKEGVFA